MSSLDPNTGLFRILPDDTVLRDRAIELARPLDAPRKTNTLEVLEFRLAAERYAVESSFVAAVHRLKDLTPLPGAPAFILGVVNIHGRIVPVIDLKKFFGLPEQGLTDLHRVILIQGHDMELGLLADMALNVRDLEPESLQPSLPTLTGIRADYLKGIGAERLIVLDLERILTDPRIIVNEEVEE
jgi:purine-binding chemotaxis protein CheW